MPRSQSTTSSTSSSSSSSSTMHKTLRRCLEWRHNVESASLPRDEEEEVPPQRNGAQFVNLTHNRNLHINPKVVHAISDMKTAEEAQSFLDVAHDIRAERAAELAMLQQQLEQSRREIRMLESKMVIALGRVVDAERGIAAMRQLMMDKGLSVDKESSTIS